MYTCFYSLQMTKQVSLQSSGFPSYEVKAEFILRFKFFTQQMYALVMCTKESTNTTVSQVHLMCTTINVRQTKMISSTRSPINQYQSNY